MPLVDKILLVFENFIIPIIILTGILGTFYIFFFKTKSFIAQYNWASPFFFVDKKLFKLIYKKELSTDDDYAKMIRMRILIGLPFFILIFILLAIIFSKI